MQKPKNMLLTKNPQFLSNFAQTFRDWSFNGQVNSSMFELNWTKNVNFSLIAYFWASALFYESVPMVGFICNFQFSSFAQRKIMHSPDTFPHKHFFKKVASTAIKKLVYRKSFEYLFQRTLQWWYIYLWGL